MRDEIDARAWVDHHRGFGNGAAQLWTDIQYVFERLVAYRYDAPWQREIGTDRRG